MTATALGRGLAAHLRAGTTPEALAGAWGMRPDDVVERAKAAGWVPEQPEMDLRPPGLGRARD